MINIIKSLLDKIQRNFYKLAIMYLIFLIIYNFLFIYIQIALYHIAFGLIWFWSFLGWTSAQILFLLLIYFLPTGYTMAKRMIDKFI